MAIKRIIGNSTFLKNLEDSGYELLTDYLYYHNHICPGCKNEMDTRNGLIVNCGTFSTPVYDSIKKIVPYVLCTNCAETIEKHTNNNDISSNVDKHLEEILSLGIEI